MSTQRLLKPRIAQSGNRLRDSDKESITKIRGEVIDLARVATIAWKRLRNGDAGFVVAGVEILVRDRRFHRHPATGVAWPGGGKVVDVRVEGTDLPDRGDGSAKTPKLRSPRFGGNRLGFDVPPTFQMLSRLPEQRIHRSTPFEGRTGLDRNADSPTFGARQHGEDDRGPVPCTRSRQLLGSARERLDGNGRDMVAPAPTQTPTPTSTAATSPVPHVVIVGCGFGGLYAARALAEAPAQVTIVDQRNHHLFQALLYQVATAALSPADIAAPIRSILRKQENVNVLLEEAKAVDLAAREVVLDDRRLPYDYLILAAGARHSYFGHAEWEPFAPGLKNLEDALEIRRRVLLAFEEAEIATDPAERDALLTFVVVGGGPTGAELAGALAEISRHSLARDFDVIDPRQAQIYLLEAAPRILPMFAEGLARKATEFLTRLGVHVRTGAMVTGIDADGVLLGSERIRARTIVWAAGVTAAPVAKTLGVPLDRAGRVLVDKDLTVPGHPEVFVIGDLAALTDAKGKPLPGVAPVAMQQGATAAESIRRAIHGLPAKPFRYKDRGSMATIGRNAAIAEIGRLRLAGFVAWLAWLFIHVMNLVGYRNRFAVVLQWLWAYFTFQRGARLITGERDRR